MAHDAVLLCATRRLALISSQGASDCRSRREQANPIDWEFNVYTSQVLDLLDVHMEGRSALLQNQGVMGVNRGKRTRLPLHPRFRCVHSDKRAKIPETRSSRRFQRHIPSKSVYMGPMFEAWLLLSQVR